MATERIELDVRGTSVVHLEVGEQNHVEWGSREYVPIVVAELPDYEGSYVVTPRLVEQTLATKDTTMREDVRVLPVPDYRVTNVGGGYTVVIAQD